METIFWHDYETFGADTRRDRPSQFAGVRTDLDLNIIEDPVTFYCNPPEDVLPAPEACVITGITPQIALENGMCEAEFAKRIFDIFSVPGTCVAGYNSIRFDDEISRNLFYRNFYDPYEREWKNGNSRWDLIDVVRLTHALRPEGINWVKDENGVPSFRLEKLSVENGIEHLSAHDAMSDVYATIGLAKCIKQAQPQLFDYVFKNRSKSALVDMIDLENLKPILHVSSKFPATRGCIALVVPILQDPSNSNAYVCFDLRQNPENLMDMSVQQIKDLLYTPTAQLPSGTERPAIKSIHINKCPMIVPASMVKTIPKERLDQWELDLEQCRNHLKWIKNTPEFVSKLSQLFDLKNEHPADKDPDLMIYSGGFFSQQDKMQMARVREANEIELAESEFEFRDARLPEMLFRYKARNFPHTLGEEEHTRWAQHCANNMMNADSGYLTFESFFKRLEELSATDLSNKDRGIIEDLRFYAESILPYA